MAHDAWDGRHDGSCCPPDEQSRHEHRRSRRCSERPERDDRDCARGHDRHHHREKPTLDPDRAVKEIVNSIRAVADGIFALAGEVGALVELLDERQERKAPRRTVAPRDQSDSAIPAEETEDDNPF